MANGAIGAALSGIGGGMAQLGTARMQQSMEEKREAMRAKRESNLAKARSWRQAMAGQQEFEREKELIGLRGEEQRKTAAARLQKPTPEKDRFKVIESMATAFENTALEFDLGTEQVAGAKAEIEDLITKGTSPFAALQQVTEKYAPPAAQEEEDGFFKSAWEGVKGLFGGDEEEPAVPATPEPAAPAAAPAGGMLEQARAAIRRGADREQVIARAREQGLSEEEIRQLMAE